MDVFNVSRIANNPPSAEEIQAQARWMKSVSQKFGVAAAIAALALPAIIIWAWSLPGLFACLFAFAVLLSQYDAYRSDNSCTVIAGEKDCSAMYREARESAEGQNYRQAVLAQGRQFVYGDLELMKAWNALQARKTAKAALYAAMPGYAPQQSFAESAGRPGLRESIFPVEQVRIGPPLPAKIAAKAQSARRVFQGSMVTTVLLVVGMGVALIGFDQLLLGGCATAAVIWLAYWSWPVFAADYAPIDSPSACYQMLGECEKTSEGRAYRQAVIAQGRELTMAELSMMTAWNKQSSSTACKQLYDIPA